MPFLVWGAAGIILFCFYVFWFFLTFAWRGAAPQLAWQGAAPQLAFKFAFEFAFKFAFEFAFDVAWWGADP